MGDSPAEKVVELRSGAAHTLASTPGWVWLVVAGVTLLLIGAVAAVAIGTTAKDEYR